MKEIITLILFLVFTLFDNIYAGSNKEAYELQERCGKVAAQNFKESYGDGFLGTKDSSLMANYTNHYNRNLNKCFILVVEKIGWRDSDNKFWRITHKTLLDIHEMKVYGEFVKSQNEAKPDSCFVLDKSCNSERKWDSLVRPYMGE